MCVLDMQVCGGGDPAVFVAPQYSLSVSLNNVRRCPANSMPMQHPLNCLSFRIRHGYEPNMQDCAACTYALKSSPPPQMRRASLQTPFEPGRYDDGPPPRRTNLKRHGDNSSYIPGLSIWQQSHDEVAAAAQAEQGDFLCNVAPSAEPSSERPFSAASMRSHQGTQGSHQHGPAKYFNPLAQHPPTPPMRPRSRSRNRNDNQVAELTKLLEESVDRNIVLTRENEELKKENANLKSWLARNGPIY